MAPRHLKTYITYITIQHQIRAYAVLLRLVALYRKFFNTLNKEWVSVLVAV